MEYLKYKRTSEYGNKIRSFVDPYKRKKTRATVNFKLLTRTIYESIQQGFGYQDRQPMAKKGLINFVCLSACYQFFFYQTIKIIVLYPSVGSGQFMNRGQTDVDRYRPPG